MTILALEFSSPQRSVAVLDASFVSDQACESGTSPIPLLKRTEGSRRSKSVTRERVETGSGSTRALGLVEEVLDEAAIDRREIDCLAIGIGPGSYTGIRNAIALAQGWQLACGVKLLGVSSVEALAVQAQAKGLEGVVDVVIDAQRNEFYLAQYKISEQDVCERTPLRLASLAAVSECAAAGETLIGPEVTRWFADGRTLFPRAATVAQIALRRQDFVAGEKLEPIYLRETRFVKAPPPRILPVRAHNRTPPAR